MRNKLKLLKLGGSVITRKDKPLTPNLEAIRRLAREISQARVPHLVLVHGGGSFGHPLAEQYRIQEGYKNPSQIMGFSKTHQAMVALDKLIVDTLIEKEVPALALPPSSWIITKLGRIHLMEMRPLTKLLERGLVPVIYGDAVLDFNTGFAILSGDQIVSSLAIKLKAACIVVAVDVDGLYTADPKTDSAARLIHRITPEELKKIQQRIEQPKVRDVTGGMLGKVLELMPAVKQGILAMILNAEKSGNVYKALKGEEVIGTIIEERRTVA